MSNKDSLIISIELSRRNGTVAATIGEEDIVEIPAIQGDREKDAVMPSLHQAVSRVGGNQNNIKTIYISIGPGSFTGLRVAVATAKTISFVTGASIVPVETALGVVRADVNAPEKSIVVSAVKKETCWLSVVTKEPKWICEGRLVNTAELPTYIERATVLYGDSFLPNNISDICDEMDVPIKESCSTATSILEVGQTLGDHPRVSAARLLPLYPREPEAVRKWKESRHQ